MGIPTTFKHLDLTWKPHIKAMNEPDEDTDAKKPAEGGYSYGSVRQGSGKRTLKSIKTHFYVGSEDGEIVYTDWMPQKDQDSGKIQTPKPEWYHGIHDGPVSALQRSPFFKDVILCVGGWTFSIWKEGVSSGPILMSSASTKRFTAGHWSPSRPAVFYITKVDGSVDIWDLLDRTHEPSMNQSVTSAPITAIFPYQVTPKQHLLAVGDSQGTLHMLEIPLSLRQPTPNEDTGVSNYFEREVRRRAFVESRWDFREREKMEIEQEKKAKAGIAPNVTLTDEEVEQRMKMEYQQYMEEENSLLRQLGLKEEVEEPLPQLD
ncbi:hypothetical protein CAPTEDRAFT_210544 [Capitella teleta]|uniref:Uncharacterized protein n=1 Tax=Capitella teleta TaxID=283909 RepID=R7TI55_CAPTE|nr:hypothetical protein CAPTEDRAFT_210544 [Capitella teleta]|eukprot:ELT93513.1 hypothetical protein CAPTEDRAFT_210544 [Capitella teleta]